MYKVINHTTANPVLNEQTDCAPILVVYVDCKDENALEIVKEDVENNPVSRSLFVVIFHACALATDQSAHSHLDGFVGRLAQMFPALRDVRVNEFAGRPLDSLDYDIPFGRAYSAMK